MRTVIQKIDLSVQVILIFGILSSLLYSIFDDSGLFFSAVGLFFIGVWQLLSAFLYTIVSASRLHAIYLMAALLYCFLLWMGVLISDQFPDLFIGFEWLLIIPVFVQPFFACIYYFFLCERAINMGQR